MAILAVWMAPHTIYFTATASANVALTPWSPSRPAGSPAHLSLAHAADYRVTSGDLCQRDAALRTAHGHSGGDHFFDFLSRKLVHALHLLLVLVGLTGHTGVQGLAWNTILCRANGTTEHRGMVLDQTPTDTVRSFAVEGVIGRKLRFFQRSLKICVVLFSAQEALYLTMLYDAFTGLIAIFNGTLHVYVLCEFNQFDQTFAAKAVIALG